MTTIEDFERETGIHVNYDIYDSSSTVDAKLMAGPVVDIQDLVFRRSRGGLCGIVGASIVTGGKQQQRDKRCRHGGLASRAHCRYFS